MTCQTDPGGETEFEGQDRTICRVAPVLLPAPGRLCRLAYPGHPKGCPNFGRRETCPPAARPLGEVLDLSQPVWAVWNRFDLAGHVERLRRRHPDWSMRQLRCCRYWQGTARKQLRGKVEAFLADRPGLVVLYVPEACGVDLTATMASIGAQLEWPPVRWTHQVALCGTPSRRATS